MNRASVVAFTLIAGYAGAASAGSSVPFESIEIVCSTAPNGVRPELPSGLQKWAKLSCTKYGQVIRAANGWIWHSPMTNEFVRLWAQAAEGDLSEGGRASYFTAIEFRKLSQSEAEEANNALASSLGAMPLIVADAYVLTAKDNGGRVQTVFIRSVANVRIGNL